MRIPTYDDLAAMGDAGAQQHIRDVEQLVDTVHSIRTQLDSLCARMIAERQDMAGQLAAIERERDEARERVEDLRSASINMLLVAERDLAERERDEAREARDRAFRSEERALDSTEEFCRRPSLVHIRRDDLEGMKSALATTTARYEKAHADCQEMIRVNDELTTVLALARTELEEARESRDRANEDYVAVLVTRKERDAAIQRAEQAESLLSQTISNSRIVESMVTERIATWLDGLTEDSPFPRRDYGVQDERIAPVAEMLAAAIRAGAHSKLLAASEGEEKWRDKELEATWRKAAIDAMTDAEGGV